MHISVILAHPDPQSFNHAIAQTAVVPTKPMPTTIPSPTAAIQPTNPPAIQPTTASTPSPTPFTPPDILYLQAAVDNALAGFSGVNSYTIIDLQTGEQISQNPNIAIAGMSLIKIPLLVETFRALDNHPGIEETKLLTQTTSVSSNFAANLLLRDVVGNGDIYAGADTLNQSMRDLGLYDTFIAMPYDVDPPSDRPQTYLTTANQRTDITKDNPAQAVATLQRWNEGEPNKEIQWITRHALRSLVKAGDPDALALLGFDPPQVSMSDFTITPDHIHMGDKFALDFTLHSEADTEQKLVVDYIVHFVKANGKTSAKVFKLKTAVIPPHQSLTIHKKHHIKPITTRRYYSGVHRVEVQVNGKIVGGSAFELTIED